MIKYTIALLVTIVSILIMLALVIVGILVHDTRPIKDLVIIESIFAVICIISMYYQFKYK